MLTNSYQLAQDFWEYIPAMTITDCRYFPLCLSYWCCPMISDDRRKFRSQISDNMDREEKKKEDQSRESQKKEDPGARKKVGKSRNIVFPMICGSGWSRVGSLKRRVRSQLARWEMKNCTLLWREARAQVKMHETHQVWSTFWSWDVEKVHALWRKAHFQVKMYKTHQVRSTFGSWDVKCAPLWRDAHFQVKTYKTLHVRSTFGSSDIEKSARPCGAKHVSKSKC